MYSNVKLRYIIEDNSQTVYFDLYDVAKGLKFTRQRNASSDEPNIEIYKINKYLLASSIYILEFSGSTYISEADYYRLAFHSRSTEGMEFQITMSTEVIPLIHRQLAVNVPYNQLISSFNELNKKVLALELQLNDITSKYNELAMSQEESKNNVMQSVTNLVDDQVTHCISNWQHELQTILNKYESANQSLDDQVKAQYQVYQVLNDQVATALSTVNKLVSSNKELKLSLIKQENRLDSIKSELQSSIQALSDKDKDKDKEASSNILTKLKNLL